MASASLRHDIEGHVNVKLALVAIIGVTAVGMFHSSARAQAPASPGSGVYTEAQAKRGEILYDQGCAECHGASLGGAEAPPLAGGDFISTWTGQTLGDLLEKLQVSMPAGSPTRMTLQEKADVLAYMLRVNNFPAGSAELSGDVEALKKMPFGATKP